MMPLLNDAARAALTHDRDAPVARLAHPERRDALRRAPARLAQLPPGIAVPTHRALDRWMAWHDANAADALADALQAHGDVFLEIAAAVTGDDRRAALLPLPEDAALADALRALAGDDPPVAQRLACARHERYGRAALLALLAAAPAHADAVWSALAETDRRSIVDEVRAEMLEWTSLAERAPIAALALAALQSGCADLRNAGRTALAARPAPVRAIWAQRPPSVQQTFGDRPACADLPIAPTLSATRRGLRLRRV